MNLSENAGNVAEGPAERSCYRGLLFRVLSWLWFFPSFGASWILARAWPRLARATGLTDALAQVAIEEWIAIAILLLHAYFAAQAWRYRRLGNLARATTPPESVHASKSGI